MSLYPSLEDMQVGHMQQAQVQHHQAVAQPAVTYPPAAYGTTAGLAAEPAQEAVPNSYALYPSLDEYMGLNLTPEMVAEHMAVVTANQPQNMQVDTRTDTRTNSSGQMQVAPVSGNAVGIRRAEIKQGVREVILCKDADGKMGLRVRAVNKGVFVALVHANSPAALAGMRFGDQILQIDGQTVAGWDTDKTMKFLKKCNPERITVALRDRPFERIITMQKDSTGHIGFIFNDGKITQIVKDSSAARNGVLIEHHLIEVDGQNVVGLKDKQTREIFEGAGRTVTITIMPTFVYQHIVKCMGSSLVKKLMDHSIPDL